VVLFFIWNEHDLFSVKQMSGVDLVVMSRCSEVIGPDLYGAFSWSSRFDVALKKGFDPLTYVLKIINSFCIKGKLVY
jgi:hypothetical protein